MIFYHQYWLNLTLWDTYISYDIRDTCAQFKKRMVIMLHCELSPLWKDAVWDRSRSSSALPICRTRLWLSKWGPVALPGYIKTAELWGHWTMHLYLYDVLNSVDHYSAMRFPKNKQRNKHESHRWFCSFSSQKAVHTSVRLAGLFLNSIFDNDWNK